MRASRVWDPCRDAFRDLLKYKLVRAFRSGFLKAAPKDFEELMGLCNTVVL